MKAVNGTKVLTSLIKVGGFIAIGLLGSVVDFGVKKACDSVEKDKNK
jgi:putative flippase GtrA